MKEINTKNAAAIYAKILQLDKDISFHSRMAKDYPNSAEYENTICTSLSARRQDLISDFNAAAEKLTEAIKTAEGRATVRKITAATILDELHTVETRLNIPKKALAGVAVVIDANAQNFPNAYKYTPESTIFRAVYRGGAWRITDIYRDTTHRAYHGHEIIFTDAARAAILDGLRVW